MYSHVRSHNSKCQKNKSYGAYQRIEPAKTGRRFKFIRFVERREIGADQDPYNCLDYDEYEGDQRDDGETEDDYDEEEEEEFQEDEDGESEDEEEGGEAQDVGEFYADQMEHIPGDTGVYRDIFSSRDINTMDDWMKWRLEGRLGDVFPRLLQWILDTRIPKTQR
eukprot:jgi/Picsp_1/3031/NSC_01253-R1_---NA---